MVIFNSYVTNYQRVMVKMMDDDGILLSDQSKSSQAIGSGSLDNRPQASGMNSGSTTGPSGEISHLEVRPETSKLQTLQKGCGSQKE